MCSLSTMHVQPVELIKCEPMLPPPPSSFLGVVNFQRFLYHPDAIIVTYYFRILVIRLNAFFVYR